MEKEFKYLDGTSFTLDEGVDAAKFYAGLKIARMPKDIKIVLLEHGYDLSVVPGAFVKVGTMDAKELKVLEDSLKRIEEMGLKDIFNANLRLQSFNPAFVSRVQFCQDNGIPYVDENGQFLKELNSSEAYGLYTASKPLEEIKTAQEIDEQNKKVDLELDEEDNAVKFNILKTLGEISTNVDNPTLTFLISSIIANLDKAILNDNKKYKLMGVQHLIENALEGVNLTNEMQDLLTENILVAFPLENEMERGIVG